MKNFLKIFALTLFFTGFAFAFTVPTQPEENDVINILAFTTFDDLIYLLYFGALYIFSNLYYVQVGPWSMFVAAYSIYFVYHFTRHLLLLDFENLFAPIFRSFTDNILTKLLIFLAVSHTIMLPVKVNTFQVSSLPEGYEETNIEMLNQARINFNDPSKKYYVETDFSVQKALLGSTLAVGCESGTKGSFDEVTVPLMTAAPLGLFNYFVYGVPQFKKYDFKSKPNVKELREETMVSVVGIATSCSETFDKALSRGMEDVSSYLGDFLNFMPSIQSILTPRIDLMTLKTEKLMLYRDFLEKYAKDVKQLNNNEDGKRYYFDFFTDQSIKDQFGESGGQYDSSLEQDINLKILMKNIYQAKSEYKEMISSKLKNTNTILQTIASNNNLQIKTLYGYFSSILGFGETFAKAEAVDKSGEIKGLTSNHKYELDGFEKTTKDLNSQMDLLVACNSSNSGGVCPEEKLLETAVIMREYLEKIFFKKDTTDSEEIEPLQINKFDTYNGTDNTLIDKLLDKSFELHVKKVKETMDSQVPQISDAKDRRMVQVIPKDIEETVQYLQPIPVSQTRIDSLANQIKKTVAGRKIITEYFGSEANFNNHIDNIVAKIKNQSTGLVSAYDEITDKMNGLIAKKTALNTIEDSKYIYYNDLYKNVRIYNWYYERTVSSYSTAMEEFVKNSKTKENEQTPLQLGFTGYAFSLKPSDLGSSSQIPLMKTSMNTIMEKMIVTKTPSNIDYTGTYDSVAMQNTYLDPIASKYFYDRQKAVSKEIPPYINKWSINDTDQERIHYATLKSTGSAGVKKYKSNIRLDYEKLKYALNTAQYETLNKYYDKNEVTIDATRVADNYFDKIFTDTSINQILEKYKSYKLLETRPESVADNDLKNYYVAYNKFVQSVNTYIKKHVSYPTQFQKMGAKISSVNNTGTPDGKTNYIKEYIVKPSTEAAFTTPEKKYILASNMKWTDYVNSKTVSKGSMGSTITGKGFLDVQPTTTVNAGSDAIKKLVLDSNYYQDYLMLKTLELQDLYISKLKDSINSVMIDRKSAIAYSDIGATNLSTFFKKYYNNITNQDPENQLSSPLSRAVSKITRDAVKNILKVGVPTRPDEELTPGETMALSAAIAFYIGDDMTLPISLPIIGSPSVKTVSLIILSGGGITDALTKTSEVQIEKESGDSNEGWSFSGVIDSVGNAVTNVASGVWEGVKNIGSALTGDFEPLLKSVMEGIMQLVGMLIYVFVLIYIIYLFMQILFAYYKQIFIKLLEFTKEFFKFIFALVTYTKDGR